MLQGWSMKLYSAACQEGKMPKEAKDLLANCNGCGYQLLRQLHVELNPVLSDDPVDLISRFPSQDGGSYHHYCRHVDFYYIMNGFIDNVKVEVERENEQDRFIKGLTYNSRQILEEVKEARESLNTNRRDKYTGAQFQSSIGQLVEKYSKGKFKPGANSKRTLFNKPSCSLTNSMDFDFNDYFGSEVPLHELITNGQDYDLGYANLSTAKNIALYSLNGNDVDFDQASGNDQRMFISLTHALSKDLNSFDITKPCVLCGDKGHTFDDCKELQDGFLKPAYIKLRLLTNRL